MLDLIVEKYSASNLVNLWVYFDKSLLTQLKLFMIKEIMSSLIVFTFFRSILKDLRLTFFLGYSYLLLDIYIVGVMFGQTPNDQTSWTRSFAHWLDFIVSLGHFHCHGVAIFVLHYPYWFVCKYLFTFLNSCLFTICKCH